MQEVEHIYIYILNENEEEVPQQEKESSIYVSIRRGW
jgi:hypothetical protein